MSHAKSAKGGDKDRGHGQNRGLSEAVHSALVRYFADLDGHPPSNLYDLVIAQVEKPLFEVVLQNARGNVSRAAEMLGINRGTLRSRLRKYGLDG